MLQKLFILTLTVSGLSQKKELSPGLAGCYLKENKLKYVKSASCVTQLSCNRCQKCCLKSVCRGQTSKLWANLAGSGCRSKSGSNPERGLHPPLLDLAKTHKVSHSHKLLCQSPQEPLPAGGITSAYRQKCSGNSTKPNISGIFQPTIFSPKAQQQVETYIRSEQTESFQLQNGDTRNRQDIPPTRGVGHLNRFQGRLLPYTNTGTVQEISQISCPGSDIPIQSSAFQSVHSTLGVHSSTKETEGHTQGYKNPPVPRRLVGESQIPPGLSPAHSRSSENMPRTRLAGEFRKVRTGTKADIRFCRLPVRPQGPMASLSNLVFYNLLIHPHIFRVTFWMLYVRGILSPGPLAPKLLEDYQTTRQSCLALFFLSESPVSFNVFPSVKFTR